MALARNAAHVATIIVAVFPVHGGIQLLSNQPFLFALEQLFLPFGSMKPAMIPPAVQLFLYSLLAGRGFVLGTSHTQIKPK